MAISEGRGAVAITSTATGIKHMSIAACAIELNFLTVGRIEAYIDEEGIIGGFANIMQMNAKNKRRRSGRKRCDTA
jgi:hypothetical protein